MTPRVHRPDGNGNRARRHLAHVPKFSVLLKQVQPGDVVLIMTGGSFGGLHHRLLDSLRESE